MSRKNNKRKLRANLEFVLPILYNNPEGEDSVYDVPIKLPIGLSKEKSIRVLKYIFNFYCPSVSFKEICEMQGWKFLIQWSRRNYEYL